ncbi:unnamed protein product [Prunus armeniaca]
MVKDINAQIIEDPSVTRDIGSQTEHSGEVIVKSVITSGDLELPFGDEEDQHESLVEQPAVEATPSTRRKRKEVALVQGSTIQPEPSVESSPPPATRSKRPRKRTRVEFDEIEEPAAVPTETSGTDDELRGAFEAIEQEKGQEEEEDVPLKEKDKEPEEEVEHSIAVPKLEVEAEHFVVVPVPEVAENKTTGILAVVTSPSSLPLWLCPSILSQVHLPWLPLLIQNWQSLKLWTGLPSWTNWRSLAPLMARQNPRQWMRQWIGENMAPRPILEISLGMARDVLNLHNRYEDLKPSFKASEFCKATHEANLVDYQKQRAELDQMVAGLQNKLGAGLGTKTKTTFLVQNMVATSRPALESSQASLHQGMLLQQEIYTKKTGLQETLKKLGL